MTNQVDDYRDSKPSIFGRTAETVPRSRGAGGAESRCDQVLTTKVGLHIPVGLAFEEWERAGRQLSGLLNSSSWWLGDWLVYGKDQYADRYERGIRAAASSTRHCATTPGCPGVSSCTGGGRRSASSTTRSWRHCRSTSRRPGSIVPSG